MISAIFLRSKVFVQQNFDPRRNGCGVTEGGNYDLGQQLTVIYNPKTPQSVPDWVTTTQTWQLGVQDRSIIPQ